MTTKPAGFGAGPVKIGQPMQTIGLNRFKAKQGQTILINPLVDDVWPFLVGYKNGVGMVHYFDEAGVKQELMDKVPEWTAYFVIPIVVYQEWNTATKKLMGNSIDFQYLRLNEKTYKDVFETYAALNGSVAKMDWVVTCDNEAYQRMAFQTAGERKWPKFGEEQRDAAKAFMKLFRFRIDKSFAKRMTAGEYFLALAEAGKQFSSGQVDFDQPSLPNSGAVGNLEMDGDDGLDDFLSDQPVDAEHAEEGAFNPAEDAETSDDLPWEDEDFKKNAKTEEAEEDLGDEDLGIDEDDSEPEEEPEPAKKSPAKKSPAKKAAKKSPSKAKKSIK